MTPSIPAEPPTPLLVEAVALHDHAQAPVEETSYRLSSWAAIVTSVCAVHCLATPFLVGVLPLVGLSFFAAPWFEWSMVALAAAMGSVGFGLSYFRLHNNPRPFIVFVAGLAILSSAHLLFEAQVLVHGAVVILGALVIYQAGRMNHTLVHACERCHPHPHHH
jgi:hypothetical protein